MQRPPSITSNEALLNYLKHLEKKINVVENKGTGTIGFIDEATGVETIIGNLPDGTVGLQEFINDVTPPEQPTTPVVTAGVAFLRVSWNGLDVLGGTPPKDYDRTLVEKSTNGIDGWIAVEELRGNASTNVGNVPNDSPTYFRLVSIDKNGNRSTPSAVASGTALYETPETTESIAEAIEAAQNANNLASSKIKVYFQAASPALTGNTFGDTWFDTDDGNKIYIWTGSAWTNAQDAKIPAIESLASSKIKTYMQATSPALTGNTFGDTWYDTSQGNKIYVWTGSAWTSAQDAKIPAIESLASSKIKVYYQANSPALTGNTYGDTWYDTDDGNKIYLWTGSAWTSAQDAKIPAIESLASSKIKTYVQSTSPALTGNTFGDTWYDTSQGNKIYVWTGSAWVSAQDAKIPAIESMASSKIRVYYQATSPALTGNTFGDTWFDTANGNKPYVWTGSAWTNAQDQKIIAVDQVAASKTKTYFQSTSPALTGNTNGDTWFDTGNGNKIYVWNGSSWANGQDALIQTAVNNAQAANNLASSKIKVYSQATSPALTGNTFGDTWYDTSAGNKPYVWTGSAWTSAQDASIAAASSLASSKTKTYFQSTSPALTGNTVGDTWFDTGNGNKIFIWNGSAWSSAQDAAIAAASSLASSKIKVYFQTSQPAVTGNTFGDTWFDTDDGNKIYVWNGSAWANAQDTAIGAAQQAANAANALAGTKGTIYTQSVAPSADINGLWIDTSRNNVSRRYLGKRKALVANVGGGANVGTRLTALGWNVTTITALPTFSEASQYDLVAMDAGYAGLGNGARDLGVQLWNRGVSVFTSGNDTTNMAPLFTGAVNRGTVKNPIRATGNTPAGTGWADYNDSDGNFYLTGVDPSAIVTGVTLVDSLGTDQPVNVVMTNSTTFARWTHVQTYGTPAAVLDAHLNWISDNWVVIQDQGIVTAASAAASAQATANTAVQNAQTADSKAVSATNIANSKNVILSAASAPATAGRISGDTWFDTSNGNKPYIFNGTAWVSAQDASIATAQSAAVSAQSTANTALTTATGKTKTYFQTASPALTGNTTGDIWFDTDDGNKVYVWNGSAWTSARDSEISAALTSANGKNKNYYQTDMPSGGTYILGDTWFDTDDGNKIYVYNGTTFVSAQDAAIAAAQNTANTKTKTYFQTASPALTGNTTGDIWFDTDDGNKPYVWNGSAWTSAQDATIATAQSTGASALSTANGKNKVIWSTSDASGTTGYSAGDIWFKRDASNNIIAQWEFTTSWQSRKLDDAVIANINAGKITAGTIAAARIGANTISADKLVVGDMTNLAADGNFQDTAKLNWQGSGTVTVSAGEANRLMITTAASGNNDQANRNMFQVSDGEQLYGEMWVYGAPTNVGGGGPNLHVAVSMLNGTTQWPTFQSLTRASVSGQWVKLSGSVTIPNGAKSAKVEPAISYSADAVGNVYYIRDVVVRRKATGSLIVDGAIKAGSAIIENGAIGTAHIADLAVGTAEIQDAAIKTAKIEDLAITDAKIATLNAGKITAGTLDAARIGADTITGGHIAGQTITAAEMAAGSITASAIAANSITASALAANSITATALAAQSITATAIATDTITAGNIQAGAITGSELSAGSVSATAIAANSITATALAAQSITATALAAQSITATALAAQSITATALTAQSITATALAAGSITATAIGANSITATALAANSITATAIAANQITAAALAAGSITATAMAADSITATAIAANAVTATELAAGSITATAIAAGSITASALAAQSITATALGAQSVSATAIKAQSITATALAANSITATAIAANQITASALAAGSITATAMAANSIMATAIGAQQVTATKMLMTDMEELVPNPTFHPTGEPVTQGTVMLATATPVSAGAPAAYVLKLTQRDTQPFNNVAGIPVKAGDQFYVEAMVAAASTATRPFNHYIFFSNAPTSGYSAVLSKSQAVTGTWTKHGYAFTVPSGWAYMKPYLQVETVAGDTVDKWEWYVANWSLRHMNRGELIVDGSIQGNHIKANNITASALAAGSITATALAAQSITATAMAAQSITATAIAAQSISATALAAQSITATALAADSVTASAIKAGSVTADELAAGSVSATAIAAQSITATALAAQSITATAIAANTITASALAAQSITATAIGANSITATALAAQSITATALAANSITATAIGAGSITASALSVGSITATALGAQSVSATAIKAQTITATELASSSITATAIAAQSITATAIAAQSITATALGAQSVSATAIKGQSITATALAAQSITATALAANSITASAIASQSITATALAANSVSATAIAAKTITADKLVLTSTDNLVVEGDFSNAGKSWQLGANNTINATAGRGSLPAMRITGVSTPVTSLNLVNRVPVGAEDRFRGSMWLKSNSTMASGSVQLMARAYTTATTVAASVVMATSPAITAVDTWVNLPTISPALPSGTVALEFYLSATNPAASTITDIDYVSVTRAADASLVVDGAIDGKLITGATFQTSATGARIQIDKDGLLGWDANGVNYISATSTGLSLVGKIKYAGVTDEATPRPMTTTLGNLQLPGTPENPGGIHFLRDDIDPSTLAKAPSVTTKDGNSITMSSGWTHTGTNSMSSTLDLHQDGNAWLNGTKVHLQAASDASDSTSGYMEFGAINQQFNANNSITFATPTVNMGGSGATLNLTGFLGVAGDVSFGTTTVTNAGGGFNVNSRRIDVGPWNSLALAGAWVNYTGGGGYLGGLRCRRNGEQLEFQGTIKSGAANSTIVSALPAGCVPTYSTQIIVPVTDAATGTRSAAVLVISVSTPGSVANLQYITGPAAPSVLSLNFFVTM